MQKFFFALLLCLTTVNANADQLSLLEKRLNTLEKRMDAGAADSGVSERSVRSFLDTHLQLGGFFESVFLGSGESGRNTQVAATSNTLGLNLGAEFDEDLRFSAQVISGFSVPLLNLHSDPRASLFGLPEQREFRDYALLTLITQGYVEWSLSNHLSIQGGFGYVPFGIIFQELEPVLFVRRGGPQVLRSADLVHPFWQGVHLRGNFHSSKGRFNYHLYTFTPLSSPRVPGLGSRVAWHSHSDNLHLGMSAQVGKRGSETYVTTGPDVRVRYKRLTVTTEWAKSFGQGDQPWAAHIEPNLDVFKQTVIVYGFADYLENLRNRTGSRTLGPFDPYKKWEFGGGVNWLPTSFTRLRSGMTIHDYVGETSVTSNGDRDYWTGEISAGVAF